MTCKLPNYKGESEQQNCGQCYIVILATMVVKVFDHEDEQWNSNFVSVQTVAYSIHVFELCFGLNDLRIYMVEFSGVSLVKQFIKYTCIIIYCIYYIVIRESHTCSYHRNFKL